MGKKLIRFVKFASSSVLSWLIDEGLFTLLNVVVLVSLTDGPRFLIATFAARALSSLCNYLMNRHVVFRSVAPGAMARYYLLCIVQAGASYALLFLASRLFATDGLADTLLKMGVDMLLFLASYQIQKHWVFRVAPDDSPQPEAPQDIGDK